MPCCQVCVFAFTAFLIIAERTARESYLGHTHTLTPTHTHTNTNTHRARLIMKCECCVIDSVILMCWCVFVLFDFIGVRAHVRGHRTYVCVRVCVCVGWRRQ